MERIYHHHDLWEDYLAGFYHNCSGKSKDTLIKKSIELFSCEYLTRLYMSLVLAKWPYSCEHNFTNKGLNRVAYLGQAACCLYAQVPSSFTMEAWSQVKKECRDRADSIAKEIINNWEKNYA